MNRKQFLVKALPVKIQFSLLGGLGPQTKGLFVYCGNRSKTLNEFRAVVAKANIPEEHKDVTAVRIYDNWANGRTLPAKVVETMIKDPTPVWRGDTYYGLVKEWREKLTPKMVETFYNNSKPDTTKRWLLAMQLIDKAKRQS